VETLAFYSYKGGVGRSLLLANVARSLTSLGKAVVALDFDFEAPGLHYKLARAVRREGALEGIGGAVPYLLATARGATSLPFLEKHMIEIPVPLDSGGRLWLMPAGPAPDRAYWAALKRLGEQVHFDDPSGQGLLLLLDLHARIEEELSPDYLLIDVRAGVTELSGIATTILADTAICMFVANQESLDGTLMVVEALKAAPRFKGQRSVRVVPVLARTASEPPNEATFVAGMRRLLELGEGMDAEGEPRPFVLHKIGDENSTDGFSPLHESHPELFQKLFPPASEARRRH
jgi:CobQ/CobB/MinD/ParA nucleotide binding domain